MVFLNTYTPVPGLGTILRRFCRKITDEVADTGRNQAIVLGLVQQAFIIVIFHALIYNIQCNVFNYYALVGCNIMYR